MTELIQSNFDKWLHRFSLLSQCGLFMLTAWTIYYTVIPLYSKAILEEEVAKKTIELNLLNEKVDTAYGLIRSNLIKDFVRTSGIECSGLLIPPPTLALIGKRSPNLSFEQQIIGIDVPSCLDKNRAALDFDTQLRTRDLTIFDSEFNLIKKRLSMIKQDFLNRAKSHNGVLSYPEGMAYSEMIRSEILAFKKIDWK